jgi:hypothetical protein
MGDLSASRSGKFTILKYVIGSQFFEAVFALETIWTLCGKDEFFCVAWNRAMIPRVFSSLLTHDTYLMRTYARLINGEEI